MATLTDTNTEVLTSGQQPHDLQPPSYSEAAPSSNGQLPQSGQQPPPTVAPYRPFPSVLYMHFQMFTRTCWLGSEEDNKMFAISSCEGVTGRGVGKPAAMLHNGRSTKDPMVAIAGEEATWERTLPSLRSLVNVMYESSPPPATGSRNADPKMTGEILRAGLTKDQSHAAFRFSTEINEPGAPGGMRRYDFEWREMAQEDTEKNYKRGFNLVLLGPSSTENSEGSRGSDGGLLGSNHHPNFGAEVVADVVWRSIMTPGSYKFQFLGKGQSGKLGDRWEVMAVVTAVRIFDLNLEGRATAKAIAWAERELARRQRQEADVYTPGMAEVAVGVVT